MTGERVKSWFDILYPRAAVCKVMDPLDRSPEFVSLLTPGQPPMLALPDEYDKLPEVHMDTVGRLVLREYNNGRRWDFGAGGATDGPKHAVDHMAVHATVNKARL